MLRNSPFQGLRPFAEEDAAFFFGRESDTRIVSANLRTRRLTLLYGPSGVGKSSVLQAGVVHHLYELNTQLQLDHLEIEDDFEPESPTENGSNSPDEGGSRESNKSIVVVTFESWRGGPHTLLKDAILAALEKSIPSIFTPATSHAFRQLSLLEMLSSITDYRQVRELLIILDQFEQFFLYNSVEKDPGTFADEFCRAVSSRKLRVNFLVSIREDWLASLDHFTDRIPDFFANSIRIEHLDRNSAEAAIRSPVIEYNNEIREYQKEPGFNLQEIDLEEPFIQEALDQLEQLDLEQEDSENLVSTPTPTPRKRRIQASGLQIVLQHLWDNVNDDIPPTLSKDLLPPNEAKRIFRRHLDDSLDHLGFSEKRIAEKLFPLLVTSSGTKLADTAESLAERSDSTLEEIHGLITKLIETKILNQHGPLNSQAPLPFYEITSDVIAAPIRNWIKVRRFRRRRVIQWSVLVTLLFVFLLGGIGLTVLYQSREREKIAQKKLERANRLQQWETIRRLSAKGDKQIPYLKAVLRGHEARLTSAVLTSEGQILTASGDGSAILWNPETQEPIRVFGGDEAKPIVCATISPDGNLIVTANTDGTVWMWSRSGYSVPLNGIQLRGGVGKHVTGVSFNPGGDLIAAANTNGDLLIWNANTQQMIANTTGNGKPILQISFSPSGKRLAAASDDATAKVWQVGNWSEPLVLAGHTAKVNGLAFSPDERFLAAASADATVRLFDLTSGESDVFSGHTANINSVDFDPSGKHLLTASDDGTARIWNVDNNTPPIQLKGHTDKVLSASFSPNASQVVTASRDDTACIWSADTGKLLVELRGHSSQVTYVTYSKDAKYVLTASDDATARLWFAPEDSKSFEIETPVIKPAKQFEDYVGPCPVIVSFDASITASKGAGRVTYRFRGSDGRIWPSQELVFDKPSTQYLKWYWRITESSTGAETIEVLEPRGIKDQRAEFKVTCNSSAEPASGTPSNPAVGAPSPPSSTPTPTSSPSPSPSAVRQ